MSKQRKEKCILPKLLMIWILENESIKSAVEEIGWILGNWWDVERPQHSEKTEGDHIRPK